MPAGEWGVGWGASLKEQSYVETLKGRKPEMLRASSIVLGQCPNTCVPVFFPNRPYLWRHTLSFTLAQRKQSVNICQVRLNSFLMVTKHPYCHTSENRGRWPLRLSTDWGNSDKAGTPLESWRSRGWRICSRGRWKILGGLVRSGSHRGGAGRLPYQ